MSVANMNKKMLLPTTAGQVVVASYMVATKYEMLFAANSGLFALSVCTSVRHEVSLCLTCLSRGLIICHVDQLKYQETESLRSQPIHWRHTD